MSTENTPPAQDGLDFLAQMRQGVEMRFVIRCRAASLAVRPLALIETGQIMSAVMKEQISSKQDWNSVLEAEAVARETLKLASTSDVGANDPKITDYLLQRMTNDEIRFLYQQYAQAAARVNPALETMPEKELLDLVEALKKSADPGLALIELTFSEIINVCRRLLIAVSLPDSSSGGPSTPSSVVS